MKSMLQERLADNLVHARREAGLTQVELARRLGVDQSKVSRWEAGKYMPNLEQLDRIAVALGKPGAYFWDGAASHFWDGCSESVPPPPRTKSNAIPIEWEIISGDSEDGTSRTKTIGGWLVHSWYIENGFPSSSMTFVPDPGHAWEVE